MNRGWLKVLSVGRIWVIEIEKVLAWCPVKREGYTNNEFTCGADMKPSFIVHFHLPRNQVRALVAYAHGMKQQPRQLPQ